MTPPPLVYWAQRHEEIYLRVELTNAQNIGVHIHENILQFTAEGNGDQGQSKYKFSLEFSLPVKRQVSHHATQRRVNITVRKVKQAWWQRLTAQECKPPFLAQDPKRWLEEWEAEALIREREERRRLRALNQTQGGFVTFKTGYLLVYNLVQFVSFLWLFINMTVRLLYFGRVFLYNTYSRTLFVMRFCQILTTLEVFNAAFGIVKTSVLPTLMQVEERNFILFMIFETLKEMQQSPVIFFVFYLWSAVEIFRYPFYILACLNTEWKTLTWLRYTVWIPLCPLGFVAEVVAVIQSMPLFDVTEPFNLPVMTVGGTNYKFSHFLPFYLLCMLLGLMVNVRHLNNQRRLHSKKRKVR